MKAILIILLCLPFYLSAQEFSTYLYFETADGARDSVLIGYDPEATSVIDTQYGERDIKQEALADSIDIRMALVDYYSILCMTVIGTDYYDYYNPYLILHESKIDISPKECNRFIFDTTIYRTPFFSTILIPYSNYPLTMSWDSTVFQNDCVGESFFSSWNPGGWFDAGCGNEIISQEFFKERSSFELSEPLNLSFYNENFDTLTMLFLTLESALTVDVSEVEEQHKTLVFPNPTNGVVHVSHSTFNHFEILNLNGDVLLSGTNHSDIDITHLPEGVYFVRIWQNQKSQTFKIVKS